MNSDVCSFKQYSVLDKKWENHFISLHQEMSLEAKWNLQRRLGNSEIDN